MRNDIKKELKDFCNFLNDEKIENRNYNRNIVIEKKEHICPCGNKMDKQSKMCKLCADKKQRKVERPEYKILINDINELGYTGTGRKYGVSDNAIRKWKKYYENVS